MVTCRLSAAHRQRFGGLSSRETAGNPESQAGLAGKLLAAKLDDGMPRDDIAERLDVLLSELTALTAYVHSLQTNLTSLRAELQSGLKRVDDELNAARSRDQDLQRLVKFSVQANDGLRESVEARFDESDVKQDEQ